MLKKLYCNTLGYISQLFYKYLHCVTDVFGFFYRSVDLYENVHYRTK